MSAPSILYLTYDGLNDPLGQSQILPYLEGLADKGCEITVISFEKENKLKVEASKLTVIPLTYHKSPPVFSTLYDLNLLRSEVKIALKNQQVDIIHCRSYVASLVGLWAKRKYGVKFIFDMRGFWADERVEGGLWNLKRPLFRWIYGYFKQKEKQFISEADAVVSLTNNAKSEIVKVIMVNEFNGSAADKITVIPTCADLHHFSKENIEKYLVDELRKNFGIQKDDFVLLYLGSLGTWYKLEEMLDFYNELKTYPLDEKVLGSKQKGNFKFLFVTKDQEVLRKSLEGRNFQKDEIIITSCQRQDVPTYISLCDASIFFIIPTYSKKASAATKMGEIMAMGKPVITNKGWGDVEDLITKKNGVLVDDFQFNSYKKAVGQLINAGKYDSTEIRNYANLYFSLDNGIDAYYKIYKNMRF